MHQDIDIDNLLEEYNYLIEKLFPNGVYATIDNENTDFIRLKDIKKMVKEYYRLWK